MKKIPTTIPFIVWKDQFTEDEIYDLIDDRCKLNDESIQCPSCDGEGSITLTHTYTGLDGTEESDEYNVCCNVCNGLGSFTLDEIKSINYDSLLIDIYNDARTDDMNKYTEWYNTYYSKTEVA